MSLNVTLSFPPADVSRVLSLTQDGSSLDRRLSRFLQNPLSINNWTAFCESLPCLHNTYTAKIILRNINITRIQFVHNKNNNNLKKYIKEMLLFTT